MVETESQQTMGNSPNPKCSTTKEDVVQWALTEVGKLAAEQDAKVISEGLAVIEHLETHWLLPHQPIWCLTTKLPITDLDDKVIGLIGFSRDISVSLQPSDVPIEFANAMDVFQASLTEGFSPGSLA